MHIKSAAVPHFSKANGKIYYAVRMCPANVADEPYTIYRRWDDFLDFSQKLASVFPANTPEPDSEEPNAPNNASFIRRVPRLSKRVVLFVTASTHASRRDELDLFVRQLFSLSRAVTSFPLVREFFAIRSNGMDGKLPPSPTLGSQYEHLAVGGHGEGGAAQQQQQQHRHAYASIRERSPTIETVFHPPAGTMRPSLKGKRSTPDLRRFMHGSSDGDEHSSYAARPSPSPRSFRFPAHAQGRVNTAPASPAAGTASSSIRQCLASFDLDDLQRSAPTSPVRMGVAGSHTSGSGSGSGSDTASTRTASTVRPTATAGGLSRTPSRIASPLSFDSAVSGTASNQGVEDGLCALVASGEEQTQGTTKGRPTPGALKHFRSLQDIRTVVSPRPVLAGHVPRPSLSIHQPAHPPYHHQAQGQVQQQYGAPPPPLPVTRSRSDSRIIMVPLLSQVAEDEPVSSGARPGPRRSSTAKSSTSRNNRSGTMISKTSLEDLHRRAATQMAFTPISAPPAPMPGHVAGGNRHKHTPSKSSIASTLSSVSSSSSSAADYYHLGSSSISCSSSSSSRVGTTAAAAAGIGLGFTTSSSHSAGTSSSSSSLESFDFSISSSDRSSPIDSPNSSFGSFPTDTQGKKTATGTGTGAGAVDEAFEKWQIDTVNGNFIYNNHLPPMPFFPTPGACDVLHHQQMQQQHKVAESQSHQQQHQQAMYSHSTARRHGRHRASSLHTPVLETILASPILGGAAPAPTSAEEPTSATFPISSGTGTEVTVAAGQSLTIKLMTAKGNYLMKVPKSSSLRQVREKVSSKCQSAELVLERGFELHLCSASGGAAGKGDDTAKSTDTAAATTITKGMTASGNVAMVELQDEEDWQLALSLASTKITLRVA